MKNTAITVINGRTIRIARAGASRSWRNQWELDAITPSSARRLVRVIGSVEWSHYASGFGAGGDFNSDELDTFTYPPEPTQRTIVNTAQWIGLLMNTPASA